MAVFSLISGLGLAQSPKTKFIYDFETKATLPEFYKFQTKFEIFENPDQTGLNTSLLVGRVSKIKDTSLSWAGIVMTNQPNVNISDGGYLKMKVFATTKMGTVQVKLETADKLRQVRSSVEITKQNEWQELIFHYKKGGRTNYPRIVLIFDIGSLEEHIYYFDDITWMNGSKPN